MPSLLHVNASPRGGSSKSLTIANSFLGTYQESRPDVKLDTWNLFDDPLPGFETVGAAAKMSAFAGQPLSDAEADQWARARVVFDRFATADEYVFNVPMWNHGVPYVLKQWIDLITQPGWAFGFHPEHGYSGLVTGKRAVVVYTSGVYRPGGPAGFGSDFHSTFFNDWLRFVGVTDITEVDFHCNNLVYPDEQATALAAESARAAELGTVW